MSEFRTDRHIYRQIVDYACALILKGQWLPGEKIPSVRELAVGMGVNIERTCGAGRSGWLMFNF